MLPTGDTFMEQTRYENLSASDQSQGIPAPPLEKAAPEGTLVIPLPGPEEITVSPLDCRAAIEERRSIRHFARSPLND